MAGTLQIGGVDLATHDTGTGEVTVKGNVVVPDGGTIGSASDTDAITIDASGNVTFAQTISAGTIGNSVVFPGKIIKNVYVDSTGTDTGITNSTTNKVVYSVSIPSPQTSYSYLIIGGIGGYLDSGGEKVLGSLIKDHGLGTQAYIKDTLSLSYQFSLSYNDVGFFVNLNYYYEPATSTAFTIDAAVRSDGAQTYRSPFIFKNQLIVLELGGN